MSEATNHNDTTALSALLDEFLDNLRDKGLTVDVDDYVVAAQLLQQFREKKLDLEALKHSLSAIICRSGEEQKHFSEYFETYLDNKLKEQQTEENKKKELELAKAAQLAYLKRRRQKTILATILILLLAIAALLLFLPFLKADDYKGEGFHFKKQNHYTTEDTVRFALPRKEEAESGKYASRQTYYQKYFDQRINIDSISADWDLQDTAFRYQKDIGYRFEKSGPRKISVLINPEKNKTPIIDSIFICDALPKISHRNEIYANQPTRFSITDSLAASVIWTIDQKDTVTPRGTLDYTFTESGPHAVSCRKPNDICAHNSNKVSFIVRKDVPFSIEPATASKSTPLVTENLTPLFFSLLLAFSIITLCLLVMLLPAVQRYLKNIAAQYIDRLYSKKIAKYFSQTPSPSFNSEKLPADIRFYKKDMLIKGRSAIRKWTSDLEKKIETEDTKLSLVHSISASIKNFDLFTPVFKNKNKKRCYLFLIDVTYAKGPQIRLFKYLVNQLIINQIDLDIAYYSKNPLKVFKKNIDDSIDIRRLKDDHYQSVLVVISDGYNFLDPNAPAINDRFTDDFSYWTKRLLITPVPSMDWSANEKILSGFFQIVPADSSGLLDIFQLLQKGDYTQDVFNHREYDTYSTKTVSFENIDALKAYAPDIFQWLCMLAIYPKISWEMILSLGAVFKENLVTYENLLRISRIDWIRESSFPSRIRLELLKELTLENEIAARERIIMMLEEESEKEQDSLAADEKTMQLIVNKFVLYSHDPLRYAHYKIEEMQFLQLYGSEDIGDIPLKIYLQRTDPDDPGKTWNNAFKKKTDNLEKYFTEKIGVIQKGKAENLFIRLYQGVLLASGFCLLSLCLIGFLKPDIPKLVATEMLAPKKHSVSFVKDKCYTAFNPGRLLITDPRGGILYEKSIGSGNTMTYNSDLSAEDTISIKIISTRGDTIDTHVSSLQEPQKFRIQGRDCSGTKPVPVNPKLPKIEIIYFPMSYYPEAKKLKEAILGNAPYAITLVTENKHDFELKPREGIYIFSNPDLKANAETLKSAILKSTGRNLKIYYSKESSEKDRAMYVVIFRKLNIKIHNTSDYSVAKDAILEEEYATALCNIQPGQNETDTVKKINYLYHKLDYENEIYDLAKILNAAGINFRHISYNAKLKYDIEMGYDAKFGNCKKLTENDILNGKTECTQEPGVRIKEHCLPEKLTDTKYIVYATPNTPDLNDESKAFLDKAVVDLKALQAKGYYINITGYTSNQKISQILPASVSTYLQEKGLAVNFAVDFGGKGTSSGCSERVEIELKKFDPDLPLVDVPKGENYTRKGQFLYYGMYIRDNWEERYFSNARGTLKFPEAGDVVTSLGTVNIREQVIQFIPGEGFKNQASIGTIEKNTKVRIKKVITVSKENVIWIEYETIPDPKSSSGSSVTPKK